jgi:SlyX protein
VDDDKITDIESRIAYQEHTIATLNEALVDQQGRISALEARVDALRERVRALSEAAPAGDADDLSPPHY